MKWCFALFAGSLVAFAGLFAVIEGRMADEKQVSETPVGVEGAPQGEPSDGGTVAARVEPPLDPLLELEASLERDVIEPLRERRAWSERALFSRAGPSREKIGFDFTRVEVPERLRPGVMAAIALEVGGERRLLPVRRGEEGRRLEIRIGEAWHPAREWLSNARNDLAGAEACSDALPRIARIGASFEAVVAEKLIAPLEARRDEALQGALSRVALSSAMPFELTRLEETPEAWRGRADGAIRIDSWASDEDLILPFRLETEGGTLEVHAGRRWQSAEAWLAGVGPDIGAETDPIEVEAGGEEAPPKPARVPGG